MKRVSAFSFSPPSGIPRSQRPGRENAKRKAQKVEARHTSSSTATEQNLEISDGGGRRTIRLYANEPGRLGINHQDGTSLNRQIFANNFACRQLPVRTYFIPLFRHRLDRILHASTLPPSHSFFVRSRTKLKNTHSTTRTCPNGVWNEQRSTCITQHDDSETRNGLANRRE